MSFIKIKCEKNGFMTCVNRLNNQLNYSPEILEQDDLLPI